MKYKVGIIRLTHFSTIIPYLVSTFNRNQHKTPKTPNPVIHQIFILSNNPVRTRISLCSKYTGLFNLCFNHQRDHRLILNVAGSPHLP
jgi:hypothetical protein